MMYCKGETNNSISHMIRSQSFSESVSLGYENFHKCFLAFPFPFGSTEWLVGLVLGISIPKQEGSYKTISVGKVEH